MKALQLLICLLTLQGCSGGSSSTDNETLEEPVVSPPSAPQAPVLPSAPPNPVTPTTPDVQPESTDFHRALYPPIERSVTYGEVLGLNYEASSQKLMYGEDSLQFVEYWPAQDTEQRPNLPNIVLIHGGCWSNSFRLEQSYPLATALSLNGFPVWSIEYRATGDSGGGWPGTYNDVDLAINYIYDKLDSQNNRKIILVGHSAGGHLALLARTRMTLDFTVVGLAAITNIVTYAEQNGSCNSLVTSFMNGLPVDIPEQYALANPQTGALGSTAFLFAGGRDGIVDQSQVTTTGIPFQIDEAADHFDWIHPGTTSFEYLLSYLLSN